MPISHFIALLILLSLTITKVQSENLSDESNSEESVNTEDPMKVVKFADKQKNQTIKEKNQNRKSNEDQEKAEKKKKKTIKIKQEKVSNAKEPKNQSETLKQIVKVNRNKTISKSIDNDLQNLMKSNANENVFDKKLDKGTNSKSPLESDFIAKPLPNENRKPSPSNNENSRDSESNGDNVISEKSSKVKEENENVQVLTTLKPFSKDFSKKKFNALPNIKIEKPVKVSLSKMSKKNIIKAMIYQLAWNELTIDRIKKLWKNKRARSHYKGNIFKRLMKIQKSNSKYKMKILEVVKNEMMKGKMSRSHASIGPRDMNFFKKTLKKLVKLNKSLQEMKSHDFIMTKKLYRRHRRHYHKGTENIKVSFIITFLSVSFVMILFNY